MSAYPAEIVRTGVLRLNAKRQMRADLKFGNEEQKERFLPRLAPGEWIGSFALTEPQAGLDAST
ncbi:hypothetical protein GCM10010924_58830 [Rhizobium wenxiniae]|nr:hypothetical protein GCM10010924_58830 [Rhizobium wenxiniae]